MGWEAVSHFLTCDAENAVADIHFFTMASLDIKRLYNSHSFGFISLYHPFFFSLYPLSLKLNSPIFLSSFLALSPCFSLLSRLCLSLPFPPRLFCFSTVFSFPTFRPLLHRSLVRVFALMLFSLFPERILHNKYCLNFSFPSTIYILNIHIKVKLDFQFHFFLFFFFTKSYDFRFNGELQFFIRIFHFHKNEHVYKIYKLWCAAILSASH